MVRMGYGEYKKYLRMRFGEYKKILIQEAIKTTQGKRYLTGISRPMVRMGYGEYKRLLRMTEDMLYVKYALKVKVKKGKGKTDE